MDNDLFKDIPIIDASDSDFKEQLEFNLWSMGSSSDYRNDRERPYNGQPWTDEGERGKTEVKGLTMRDIQDCFIKAMLLSSGEGKLYDAAEKGTWRPQMVYDIDWNKIDPLAVCQNLTCEIERMMSIFPNIPKE